MDSDISNKLKDKINSFTDFPKKGIIFRDVFSLLKDPEDFQLLMKILEEKIIELCPKVDVIVGLESRGFLFGPSLSLKLNVPFAPIRKAGKLPGKVHKIEYELEYGTDSFEIQSGSIKPGQNVVIVDDLLATGGTMKAAEDLILSLDGNIALCLVVIELDDLKGRNKLKSNIQSIVSF